MPSTPGAASFCPPAWILTHSASSSREISRRPPTFSVGKSSRLIRSYMVRRDTPRACAASVTLYVSSATVTASFPARPPAARPGVWGRSCPGSAIRRYKTSSLVASSLQAALSATMKTIALRCGPVSNLNRSINSSISGASCPFTVSSFMGVVHRLSGQRGLDAVIGKSSVQQNGDSGLLALVCLHLLRRQDVHSMNVLSGATLPPELSGGPARGQLKGQVGIGAVGVAVHPLHLAAVPQRVRQAPPDGLAYDPQFPPPGQFVPHDEKLPDKLLFERYHNGRVLQQREEES